MSQTTERSLSISCDDCSMQCSAACSDCVVTFLLRDDAVEPEHDTLVLSLQEARVVKMFGSAGLVPDLKYRVAG
jgi:hypothetical protein